MRIFHSETHDRKKVAAESPAEETPENTLRIFRSLNQRDGFLGIVLGPPRVLQLLLLAGGRGVKVELLDTSIPSIEWCETNIGLAESLIAATAKGQDVFQVARQSLEGWQYFKLS